MARLPQPVKPRLAGKIWHAYRADMIALRQHLIRHRSMAMIVLALAFALRVLIPQGMMAAPDAARGVTVLLCDGSGVAGRMAVPLGEKPGKASPAQNCPFAVLAQAISADAPGGWTVPPATPQPLPVLTGHAPARPYEHPHTHPPARAPPLAA